MRVPKYSIYLKQLLLLAVFFLVSYSATASQEAMVIADRAIVWADIKRTAPLGYITKGRIVKVGEVPRNKNQVIPIAISGRIGYIAMDDLSFDDDKMSAPQDVTYERFREIVNKRANKQVVFLATGFSATESKDPKANRTGETWNFVGGALKGTTLTPSERVEVIFIGEYLYAQNRNETFRLFELGLGLSFSLINARNFKLKLEAVGLVLPWAQYEAEPLFALNTYGYGGLGQAVVDVFFNENWGFELTGGLQVIKLLEIDRPSQFKDFSPMLTGTRLSGGLLYRF